MVTINEIKLKLKIYGPKNFIIFSLIEFYRIILRSLNISYSQFKEDIFIAKLLHNKKITYIDVGANHPIKFNNTYKFYKNGGFGVNIEPNPLLLPLYKLIRPHDINLNIGLGDKTSQKTFYIIDPDVNSTFSYKNTQNLIKNGCQLISTPKINIDTLANIFKKYFKNIPIDLLSIDTEGFDYQILLGNNWNKYRPRLIIIELNSPKTRQFLENRHYTFLKNIGLNQIYRDSLQ